MSTIEITSTQPSSLPKPNISPYIPSTSTSSAQADLLTSSSPIAAISKSEPANPIPNNVPSTSNMWPRSQRAALKEPKSRTYGAKEPHFADQWLSPCDVTELQAQLLSSDDS
ncbi:hypothetical protein TNCV_3874101 [Trichonephila clavipes]|nr:hypothetical protein TNCV_3874101 [Trichonephila clavipes]